MITQRSTPQGNAQRSDEAMKFAQLFFTKHDKEKETLSEMYHDQSTLIWNGQPFKGKNGIAKFYKNSETTETTLQCLDVQIIPPTSDIVDMIMIIAGGKVKQKDAMLNFSRTFLLGPNAPQSTEYLIVSDTVRIQQ